MVITSFMCSACMYHQYGRYWYIGMARVHHMRNINMHRKISAKTQRLVVLKRLTHNPSTVYFQVLILVPNFSISLSLVPFAIVSSWIALGRREAAKTAPFSV